MTDNNSKSEALIRQLYPQKRWTNKIVIGISILSVTLLLYALLYPKRAVILSLQATNHIITDTITDKLVVTLNKNSVLNYPDKFSGDTKAMTLKKGEAFFNTTLNKGKSFVINVNKVVIKGTEHSCNIKITGEYIEIIVEQGTVQVSREEDVIKLRAGEKLSINYKTGWLKKEPNTDKLYNYYRTNLFTINNTPLWRIIAVLNEAYGVNIIIADKKLAGQPLTTTLKYGQLNYNLNIICQILNAHVVRQNNKIIIKSGRIYL